MDVEALKGTDTILCEWVPNEKNLELKALAWEFPHVEGMEVDPTKYVLAKDPNKHI